LRIRRGGRDRDTRLLDARAGGPLHEVDQVEGILNRDKKVSASSRLIGKLREFNVSLS
jgi:hypothetical protein